MKRKVTLLALLISFFLSTSCSYNPFLMDNHETGDPTGAIIGAGAAGGTAALLGGRATTIGMAALVGGAIGYYVTTLRYDSGGIIQAGGVVYQVGDLVGIYIPTDNMFAPNTDELLPQATAILDSTAVVLQRFPKNNILISGNTSGFYRARWEQKLSERRAQKVSAYLWNAGINNFQGESTNMRKLNYVGYGDYFAIATHLNNDSLRQNSRIQITSYPSSCDLGLDKRSLSMHNMGALDDSDVLDAPDCGGKC